MTPTDRTLAYGERMTRALLAVDALYRAESGDGEGLAVLNMDTDGAFSPEPCQTYEDARALLSELKREAVELAEPDRRLYYDQTCYSTLAFIDWRTKGLSFEEQLGGFLHVPVMPATADELDKLRDSMGGLLQQMGYSGDLSAQCEAWEERNRVAPDEVEGVLDELMDQAWDRTEELLFEIPAPRTDGMKVSTVTDVPYNARCDYLSRTVELNVDPVLTRPALKHLTVHEGYPGHYVQFKLRETLWRKGEAPADVLLSVVNTASSSVFEGIADAGMEMVEWLDTDDDRFHALMNRYRAGIGTGAAWRLHAQGWEPHDVEDWLRDASLVGGEGWVRNRMDFISAPSRAVLIWSYWWGERSVLPLWRRIPPERRPALLYHLYSRLHSVTSVGMLRP